ncbi:MAG TPA: VTT domain-containing protein [Verrucomicrobiae bacterium]|nr:VTT domain-containing protein [Verrucomicrobiae bacterium]
MVIAITVSLALVSHSIRFKTIHHWAAELNGWVIFAIMALTPLVGMPMSLLAIMAGAKFGPWLGLAISGAAVIVNLAGSWWIARSWLHQPLEKLLQKTKYKRPQLEKGEYVGVCLLTALVPGPSYTIKNYFLALSNLPLRVLIGIGLPAHLFAMSPGIFFGNFSGAMTTAKGVFLIVYTLLLIGVSHFLIRRFRARRKKRQAAGAGELKPT